tara:strand:+ start:22587 stop:25574 length:2988 start_codon:yes stop_codon:yes gene_type:complete
MGIALNGLSTKITKLGKIFDQHSQMDVSDKEYWPWPVLGSELDGWPAERYPMLFYTSTDHGYIGGIFLRVWDRNLGELTKVVDGIEVANPDAIVEWQTISSRPEFDHISKKTNPIFVDTGNGSQTETPSVIKANGQLYLYYHNNAVDLTGYGKGATGKTYQSTKYATGTNGVDFSGNFLSTLWYDAYQIEGEGHNGYFVPDLNVIEDIPYTYIGRALHGGGTLTHGSTSAFYGSNDCENWFKIDVASSAYGVLLDDANFANGRILNVGVGQIKKEGPYYRARSHYRLRVSGGSSTEGEIVETLINSDLNIVANIKKLAERGANGEFDDESVGSCQKEITFEGRTYGFYKAISSSGVHSQGMYVTEDEPYTWDVFETLAEKQTLFETDTALDGTAPNLTYSHTPSFRDGSTAGSIQKDYYTSLVLPSDTSPGTVISTQTIDLSTHDVVDVIFKKIGKNNKIPQILEFGLIDDLGTETSKLAYYWPASNGLDTARSEPMQIAVLGANDETNRTTINYFGQSSEWQTNNKDEAPASKHTVGFRVIPSENRIVTLEGRSLNDVFDITGFDFTKPLKVFVRNRLVSSQGSNSIFSISGIEVNAYSRNAIAVPAAPTLTANKTSNSVTLSTNSVSGATGYKYFLDGIEQTDGNFTGLEPETEYTVYARAVNALGDSPPSTIQTITTDSAGTPDTTPPVVTNNGPSTLTITVGDTYTPDFSTNEGTLAISNPVDTSIAGTYIVTATATDAAGNEGTATQTVIVEEPQVNQPPVANAGPDQSVAAGATCILEGSNSSDGDGSIVSYSWRKVSGPTIALANANQAVASFIAPSESTIQTLVFELTVTDDDGATSTDTVTVTVAAVPDVADPLDPTLSVISIKSKVGIEDDIQSFGVVSLYQYTDNFILCEVVSKSNAALSPDSFSQAEYRIVDNKGTNVVKLGLGTGIKEADGKFLIHINSGILNSSHKGSLKHQFVVWNQAGYKLPPIFGGTVNIIPVLEPTL